MIGQKTLYSFFSPSPAGKRSTRSPEPAPGGDVAAEDGGDAAVRRTGQRGTRGGGRRRGSGQEHRAPCSARPGRLRGSKQPRMSATGRHAQAPANGHGARPPYSQSACSVPAPPSAWSNHRRQGAGAVLPRKGRVEGLGRVGGRSAARPHSARPWASSGRGLWAWCGACARRAGPGRGA